MDKSSQKVFSKRIWVASMLVVIIITLTGLYFYISFLKISSGQVISIQNNTSESSNDKASTVTTAPHVLKMTDIFTQEGKGKNSTDEFALLSNKATVHYKIANNEFCYSSSCNPSHFSIVLYCNGDYIDLLVNDSISDLEKDLVTYQGYGKCHFDIESNESANWTINVQEER